MSADIFLLHGKGLPEPLRKYAPDRSMLIIGTVALAEAYVNTVQQFGGDIGPNETAVVIPEDVFAYAAADYLRDKSRKQDPQRDPKTGLYVVRYGRDR